MVKRISIILFVLGCTVWIAMFLSETSFYHPVFGIHCHESHDCLHENGHRLDNGTSKTAEWVAQVDRIYALGQNIDARRAPEIALIANFPGIGDNQRLSIAYLPFVTWGGYSELYAELYAYTAPADPMDALIAIP